MKRVLVIALLAVFGLVGTVSVCLAGPAEDAKALVEKGLAYWKANGKDKAIEEFNNPKGQFVKGDLYMIAQTYKGVMLANGGNPKLAGQNHFEVKDPTGKQFVKEMIETAKKGGGWVDYSWTNPATKKIQPKSTFIKPIEGADMYIGCGYFK